MRSCNRISPACVSAALVCAFASGAGAQIANGGFESGLAGWTRADQVGSDGTFFAQSGALSPLNAFTVPAPPSGLGAAMTDAGAGGSHVLYQDFVVPAVVPSALVGFSLYLNNGAGTYFTPTPANLDWSMTNTSGGLNLNQQVRVDIMTIAADPFSVAPADVLQNLFQTGASTPPVFGYSAFTIDITTLLQAHAGQTLRLRFAETDNVNFFNLGVDDVSVAIPSPSTGFLALASLAAAARRRR